MPRTSTQHERRRVCFVTGTRAEFGLMRRTLRAIQARDDLELQLIVTGMHLSKAHGRTIDAIRSEGWTIDATVAWEQADGSPPRVGRAMGRAIGGLADAFAELKSQLVLVVGDRVEAFAAASAGQVSQIVVAHVHGGDRAEGQVDDSLRHAITKLAHMHLAATQASRKRILRLGEASSRVHAVGAPGVESIRQDAASPDEVRRFLDAIAATPSKRQSLRGDAVVLLHPLDADETIEAGRASAVLAGVLRGGAGRALLLSPNNDPGHRGILRVWDAASDGRVARIGACERPIFLGLLRDAGVLVGNSSAGIIEAGSLGTPVVNIGPRQAGRERGPGVRDVSYSAATIARAVRESIRSRSLKRSSARSPYARAGTAARIAALLASMPLGPDTLRKRICY